MYKTTYPNKVFDYMAAGKPVVLAIDGVIREVIENANAGIPVHPGDSKQLSQAILQLADDPRLAQLMGHKGRLYVEKCFDRTLIASKLLGLMLEMVA
jgi:glycosyltransferase involved in cell wall biosynthesis